MTTVMQFPTKAKEVIIRPIPDQLIKTRPGGKQTLSYISGSTVIDLLNEAFGYLWSWNVEREWIQESQPKKKYKSEELEAQGPVAHVRGVLTVLIPEEDHYLEIKKSGLGSKSVLGGQSDQESVFKAAGTDALKKAASLFGIGAQLYRDEDEQEFFDGINYEDPWTDEELAAHQGERDYIKQVMKDLDVDQDAIDEVVQDWSKGKLSGVQDLLPENIGTFTEYLRTKVEQIQKAS